MGSSASRSRRSVVMLALLSFSFTVFFVGCAYYFEYLDDGASSYGALRILKGDIPYRDFMTGIAPGHFYVLSFLFRIFSASFMVERIWNCVLWTLCVLSAYLLGRKTASSGPALISSLLVVSVVGSIRPIPGGTSAALLFSLVSGIFLVDALSERKRLWIGLSAVAAGLSILFRHDLGTFTAITVLAVLILFRENSPKHSFKAFGCGFFGILIFPAVFFFTLVPFKDLWFSFVRYPLVIYSKHCRLVYPEISAHWTSLLFYGTPVLLLFGWAWLFLHGRRRGSDTTQMAAMFFSTLIGTFFFNQVRLRADTVHVLSPLVMAAPVYGCLLSELLSRTRARWLFPVALMPFLILMFQAVFITLNIVTERVPAIHLDIPRMEGIKIWPADAAHSEEFKTYGDCVRFARENIPANEKIFVGSTRHDRVCYGDPAFYFVTNLDSGTRHQELNRGVVNTKETQAEIIGELIKNDVKYIVLRGGLDFCTVEPNASSQSSGVRDLDFYIRENYRVDRNFGNNLFLVRKSNASKIRIGKNSAIT